VISPKGWLFFSALTRPSFLLTVFLLPSLVAHVAGPQSGKQPKLGQPYALIFGTVWGPDDRPIYGVRVKIRRAQDKAKKVRWELSSDHQGEFAQRLPAGKADYVVWADLKGVKLSDGKTLHPGQEVHVHVENDERIDIGLHLTR
jgi:hypothetical protein